MLSTLECSQLLTNYCETFKQSRDVALTQLSEQVTTAFSSNTIGYRIINKLIHQYFIKQG